MDKYLLEDGSGYYELEGSTDDYLIEFPVELTAYRFYEDGTESGSTAIDAQDTNITRTVNSDSNLLLRTRLQETAGLAGEATDDYQLQYSLNGGSYYNIGAGPDSEGIVDTYATSAYQASTGIGGSANSNKAFGQSFTGNGSVLSKVKFYIKGVSSPAQTVSFEIYAHSGTFGTDSLPTGTALASASVNASVIPTTDTFYEMDLSSANLTLANGTNYVAVMSYNTSTGGGYIDVGRRTTTPLHAGNGSTFASGTWSTTAFTGDAIFEVTGIAPNTGIVNPFVSTDLTDGGATTNRLGSGTGSFVAGGVSETGLVSDHTLTASNYTEHLYALTIESIEVYDEDTLDFRVLKNGEAVTGNTVSPQITIDSTRVKPVVGTPSSYTTSGFPASHTLSAINTSGSNPYLLLGSFNKSPATEVTAVTADGSAMTKLDEALNAGVASTQVWGIIPADSSTDVVVSTPAFKEEAMIAVPFTMVDGTTPYIVPASNTATGFGTTATVTVTGTAGNTLVVFVSEQGSNTVTASGVTELANVDHGGSIGRCFAGYVEATGSPQAIGATFSVGDNWSVVAVEIMGGSAPAGTNETVTPEPATLTTTLFAPTVVATNNIAVTPGLATLTTARFAPTVVLSDNKTATPALATLTTTLFAPTVRLNQILTPGVASLTLSPLEPTVVATNNISVTPGVTSLTTSLWAPTLAFTAHVAVTPSVASLTTAVFAPTVVVSDHISVTPATASLSLTAQNPSITLSDNKAVSPGTASLTTSRFAPVLALSDNKTATPATASLVISSQTPTVALNNIVTPGVASLTTSRFAPTLAATDNKTLTPAVASLTTARFAPTVAVTAHVFITPGTASLTLTSQQPSVTSGDNREAVPGTASLTLTAHAPSVSLAVTLTPATATLSLTSYAPTVTASDHITLTPSLASLSMTAYAPSLVVGAGDIVLTPNVVAMVTAMFAPTVTTSSNTLVTPATARLRLKGMKPIVNGIIPTRNYYIDSNGGVYWVINNELGLVEKV